MKPKYRYELYTAWGLTACEVYRGEELLFTVDWAKGAEKLASFVVASMNLMDGGMVRGYTLVMREDMDRPWSINSPLFPKGEDGLHAAQEGICKYNDTPYQWDIGVVTSIMSKMTSEESVPEPTIVKEASRE